MFARQRSRHVLELVDETATHLLRPRPRAVEKRIRQHSLVEHLLLDFVAWIGDDAQRGQDVPDDLVVGKSAPLSEAARNPGVEKGGLQSAANLVRAVQHSDTTPRYAIRVCPVIASQIVEEPTDLGLVVNEAHRRQRKCGLVSGALWRALGKDRCVQRDELARKIEHRARTTMILLKVNDI